MNLLDIGELRRVGTKYAPESSTIKTLTYDPAGRVLLIDFVNSGSYLYLKVPLDIWLGLMEAKSVGSYFHKAVKNVFTFYRTTVNAEGKEHVERT